MKKRFLKVILIFIIYSLPLLLFLNLLLLIRQKTKTDLFYKTLNDIGYTKSKTDPYKEFTIQYINPHYIFGLPIQEEKRKNISNKYVSIDKNGYRTTYPLYHSNEKDSLRKCILILGGSTAFGHGVSSDRNTFSSFIQSNIGEDYLLFNLGTPSWNSRQELISAINFISRPISKKCSSIDTISITGSNDIGVSSQYIRGDLIKNESEALEFISAPESFPSLMKKVDDIRSKNYNPIMLTKELFKSLLKISYGKIYSTIKYEVISNKIQSSKSPFNLYLYQDKKTLSENDKRFIDYQMNSFWKNHIFIANIFEKNSQFKNKNRHLVVLQPNLKNVAIDSIWSFANQRMDKSLRDQVLPTNIHILDLRKFSLTDKKQQNSLRKIIQSSKSQLNKKDLLNLNYFDDVHLTDIGVKRVGKYILDEYLLITSQD